MHMSQDEIVKDAKERTPAASQEIDAIGDFGCFTEAEYEDTTRRDVLRLRGENAMEGVQVLGFSMDLATGVVKPLEV
ncbi:hypothetical protein LTR85_002500 [Meristemomyces frigidus]|nr:hypothetical protein LTR85_002500 [Meristemomyces frigidus]